MEKLNKSMVILEPFRNNPKWNDFFSRIDRLEELEGLINDQLHRTDQATALDEEAKAKREWLDNHKDKLAQLTDTEEQFNAVHAAIEAINDNSFFYSKLDPPKE